MTLSLRKYNIIVQLVYEQSPRWAGRYSILLHNFTIIDGIRKNIILTSKVKVTYEVKLIKYGISKH